MSKSFSFPSLATMAFLCVFTFGAVALTGMQAAKAQAVPNNGQETCPNTGNGWTKYDSWADADKSRTHDAGSGYEVVEVCVKGSTGIEYFTTNTTKSCWTVSGIGTQTATAAENWPGNEKDSSCKDISHASFKVEKVEEPEELKQISPILECVEKKGEGQYTARFGYETKNTKTVVIPVGQNNKVTGGGLSGIDQGQITEFVYPAVNHPANRPGRSPYDVGVFSVDFNGSNLVWTLVSDSGRTATASKNSKRCPVEPSPSPSPSPSPEVSPSPSPSPEVSPSPSPEVSPSPEASPSPSPEASPSPSATPTATPESSPTPETKETKVDVSATCEDERVNVTAVLNKDNAPAWQGIFVKFIYNNTEKTAFTNSIGRASVDFEKAGNQEVRVEPDSFPHATKTVEVETDCGAVGGVTTTATAGQVLGASTLSPSTYAATGVSREFASDLLGLAGLSFIALGGYTYVYKETLRA